MADPQGPQFNTYVMDDGRELRLPLTFTPAQINEAIDTLEKMGPGVGPFQTRNPLKIATQAIADLLGGGMSGLPGGYQSPEAAQLGTTVAKATVPQTGTEAGLLLAQPAARAMGVGKAATSLLLPTLGAGMGTAEESIKQGTFAPEGAMPGVMHGGIAGILGGLGQGLGGRVYTATPMGRAKVLQNMEREALEAAGSISPALKGIAPQTAYTKLSVFPERYLQPIFSQNFQQGLARASAAAPGASVTSPTLIEIWKKLPTKMRADLNTRTSLAPDPATMKFTVEQSQELLRIAREGAYRGTKLTTEHATKASLLKTYETARGEVYGSLPPTAKDALESTRIMHGINMGLADIFKSGNVFKPSTRGAQFDPNAAMAYIEKNGDALADKIGKDSLLVLKEALIGKAPLGARHEFGQQELVPGILERSIVITRSILKHFGMAPIKVVGKGAQPFTASPIGETLIGQAGVKLAKPFIPGGEE